MNKIPVALTRKFPLPAQPLPFYYSTVSSECLLYLRHSLYPASRLKLEEVEQGRMLGNSQLQPTWLYVSYRLNVRWCHIKGAIHSVFEHQCIVVRRLVNTYVHCKQKRVSGRRIGLYWWASISASTIQKTTFPINFIASCCEEDVAGCHRTDFACTVTAKEATGLFVPWRSLCYTVWLIVFSLADCRDCQSSSTMVSLVYSFITMCQC